MNLPAEARATRTPAYASVVEVDQPDGTSGRIVASIPHGSRRFPEATLRRIPLTHETLWADWYTRELFDFLPALGVTVVAAGYSSCFVNVNRDPASGSGDWRCAVPECDPWGRPMYDHPLPPPEVAERVRGVHAAFHDALDAVVASTIRLHGSAVLLDLHSFGMPNSADVVLGDGNGSSCSRSTVEAVSTAFVEEGFSVGLNTPWSGGWTVRCLADRIDSLQIELNQRTYLDEAEVDGGPETARTFDASAVLAAQTRLRAVFSKLTTPLLRG